MSRYPQVDFGHTSYEAAFGRADVYDVADKPARSGKRLLKLAIAGCGGVAQAKWIPAVRRLQTIGEPVTIAAIADPNRDNHGKAGVLTGAPTFETLGELLAAATPDLLLVLAPDAFHTTLARQAIEAGVACLVEKPLAPTHAEAAALVAFAEEKGVLLASVANKRFSPPYAQAKALVEADALKSPPTVFAGKFTLGYPYVDLLNGGTVHLIDLMLWFMGPVAKLHARGVWVDGDTSLAPSTAFGGPPPPLRRGGSEVAAGRAVDPPPLRRGGSEVAAGRTVDPPPFTGEGDHAKRGGGGRLEGAVISFAFRSGAIGTIMTSAAGLSFAPWERLEIFGRNAFLVVDNQIELTLHDEEAQPAKAWRPSIPNTLMFDESFGGYAGLLENVLDALRGLGALAVTGRDGAAAMAIVEAINHSLKRHAEIDLSAEGLMP